MHLLLRLTAAGIAIAFAFPPVIAAGPPAKKPALIAEIHTWGDLLAQKPFALALPAANPGATAPTCRLGIDRTHSGLYGGVALYCLIDGKMTYSISRDSLGPLAIQVVPPGKTQNAKQVPVSGLTADSAAAPTYLFMQVIPLNIAGEYTINLRQTPRDSSDSTKSPIIATAKITVTKEQARLWSPFVLSESDDAKAADDDQVPVTIPVEGIALPELADPGPIPVKTTPDAKLPLPQLFPATPDPGIHLNLRGNLLTVKFDKQVVASDPYDLIFLTRWWINGKPFIPKLVLTKEISRAIDRQARWIESVTFRIDFHPETLHVKKGDLIAVQLLFCPGGWKYTGPPTFAEQAKALFQTDQDTPIAISRLSPRIEFTYTGDPAAIAKPSVKH